MRARLIGLLVALAVLLSAADYAASQWVLGKGLAVYARQAEQDQAGDWASELGSLYADFGGSWNFLTKQPSADRTILSDGLFSHGTEFVLLSGGRPVAESPQNASPGPGWRRIPIFSGRKTIGELVVLTPVPPRILRLESGVFQSSTVLLSLVFLAAALLFSATGAVFVRRFLRPLETLAGAARAVARHEGKVDMPAAGDREIQDVVEAFRQVRDDLERARMAREKLLDDVYHELRTPMTVIANRLEAIQCGLYHLDPQNGAILYDEIMRMDRLLSDLRQLNDAQAGVLRLEAGYVMVLPWLRAAAELFRADFDRRRVRPVVSAIAPGLRIWADERRMTQVLVNLLSNALRYAPPNSTIRMDAGEMEGRVWVRVCDRGPGIAEKHLARVTERFYRADEARDRETGGSGLGLAIVDEIVRGHGGKVSIESRAGVGTCVYLDLPAAPPVDLPAAPDPGSRAVQSPDTAQKSLRFS